MVTNNVTVYQFEVGLDEVDVESNVASSSSTSTPVGSLVSIDAKWFQDTKLT